MRIISFKKDSQQLLMSVAVCAIISHQPLVYFLNILSSIYFNINTVFDTLLLYTVLLFIILLALTVFFSNMKIDIIFLIFLYLTFYLSTYMIHVNNKKYMFTGLTDVFGNPIYIFFIFSFSAYIFTRYVYDYTVFYNLLRGFSFTVILISTATYFILLTRNQQPQYMVFSYNMLVHTVFLSVDSMNNRKLISALSAGLGLIMIFIGGARGPILIAVTTIAFFTIYRQSKLTSKVIGNVLNIAILLIVYLNYQQLLLILTEFVEASGLNSRTINMILIYDFFNTSSRKAIFELQLNAITATGLGLYGDRVVAGTYAHNIIIEILVQFGYIIGPLLLLLIATIIWHAVRSENLNIRNLSIVFMSSGLFKLFISGSYLNEEPCFYVLLGLGVNAIILRRKAKHESTLAHQHHIT